jgi:hypothetical protein
MNSMRAIYTCDIGSIPSGNFGWARCVPEHKANPTGCTDISRLVDCLEKDMANRTSIALGFESPLFIAVPLSDSDLCRGRQGEGSRSLFAQAGATVTTLGIHQAAWILRKIHPCGANHFEFTTDLSKWPPSGERLVLLCWEAFVSGNAHSRHHTRDAATATMFFLDNEMHLGTVNAVTTEPSFSLIQAVALWAGWSTNMAELHASTLVIKPNKPYEGMIYSV